MERSLSILDGNRLMQVRILSHLLCDSISNSDSRDIGLISISTVLWRVGRIGKCSGSLIQRRLLRHGGSSPSHVVSLSWIERMATNHGLL